MQNLITYHRFISGNEAHTDKTKIKQEGSKSLDLKTLKIRKHKTHSNTIKTESEFTYTSTQLTKSYSNVPHPPKHKIFQLWKWLSIHAPQNWGFETIWPVKGSSFSATLERHIIAWNDVVWRQNRSTGATCARDNWTKIDKNPYSGKL